ncbi:hypothetical protein L195_g046194, partial [Trifolium pratense]
MKLSERLKSYTWFIKASYKDDDKEVEVYGTRFALKNDKTTLWKSIEESDLVLITSAHYFPKFPRSIAVRRFDDNSFLEAEVLDRKARWDTTLLVVKGANCGNYAEFCDDGSISDCQTLLQKGCSGGPIINTHGKVVGMLVGEFDGCPT